MPSAILYFQGKDSTLIQFIFDNTFFLYKYIDFRAKDDRHPVTVKFTNKTKSKVKLYWINYKGNFKQKDKVKEGRTVSVNSYEGHTFMVGSKKDDAVINGNLLFRVHTARGSHGEVRGEITRGPSKTILVNLCYN